MNWRTDPTRMERSFARFTTPVEGSEPACGQTITRPISELAWFCNLAAGHHPETIHVAWGISAPQAMWDESGEGVIL